MATQKIQFFFLKTGNGHLAPAKAIANNMAKEHGDAIKTELIDGLDGCSRLAKFIIEDGYRNSINNAVWVFETLYALHKIPVVSRIAVAMVTFFTIRQIEKKILCSKPDKIVILHFFLIKPILKVIKRHNLATQVVTVVTDPFTAHPIWFKEKQPRFVVFSQEVKDAALRKGVAPESIAVYPFILDDRFASRFSDEQKIAAKRALGFDQDKKLILVIGGGEGIPRGAAIAESIRLLNADAEVAFVCGRNASLQQKVERVKQKYRLTNLRVYGYVEFVHTLLNVSDVVVTKCGASTFMEILMAQKIPVISNYIWEQEKGNMEFVRSNRMGVYENRVHKLPQILDQLLLNGPLYSRFVQNIHQQNIRSGTAEVSQYILSA